MTQVTLTSCISVPTEPLQISLQASSLQLSLVIPTYNEKENIEPIVTQLVLLLDEALPAQYELIVVDDNSLDQTWLVAQELTLRYSQLRVMRRHDERGLSTAVVRGWQVARGEWLGVIDADLQHPPNILLQLLAILQGGADLAIASRYLAGGGVSEWSLARRFLSRGAQLLGLLILPDVIGRVSDPMSGCFIVRRSAIAGFQLYPLGYKILLEVLGRSQVKTIGEAGYVFQERVAETSKVTWKQYGEYLVHLLRLRSKSYTTKLQQQFPLERFLQYGIVGLSGVLVDTSMLYLLSDPHTLSWGLTRSKLIAAEVAILNNFVWNDLWTFVDLAKSQQGLLNRLLRFLKFHSICLVGLGLNILLLNLLFNIVFKQQHRYLANLIAIAAVTAWNFWLNLKLNWRVAKTE